MSTSDKENNPPNKKRKLSLSLKNRFKSSTEEERAELEKPRVPKNTEVNTKWAMKNFTDWVFDYNTRHPPEEQCPKIVLNSSCPAEDLNKWLGVFIIETRNHDGRPYPPKTIHCILCGILRHMRAENVNYPNFLDKNNPAFSSFQTSLNNLFKQLRSSGVGAESVQTEGISHEEENRLWESGVLNTDTPKGLLRAVFFYNGKCFCLRGGQEHRELAVSQLKRRHDPDRYVYVEKASKNRPGGVSQLKLQHKSVTIVSNPKVGNRCHVALLDKYISKLPPGASS